MGLYTKIIDLQKLNKAWDHVRKNNPACGADQVTVDEFNANRKVYLQKLQMELQAGTYKGYPVKTITLHSGEKAREVSLFSMRDKVIHQSIASELEKIYEPLFPQSTCAYRPGRSAIREKERIEKYIENNPDSAYYKADIYHFFDEIDQDALLNLLKEMITEKPVIELIQNVIQTEKMETDGSLQKNSRGIYQGSSLAPILSNICLYKMDQLMEKRCDFYIRYADDMLFLAKDPEKLDEIPAILKKNLAFFGLSLNEKKCETGTIKQGFSFLGYEYHERGSSIPVKAMQKLEDRLSTMWRDSRMTDFQMKLKKGAEIVGGWEQYYKGERSVGSIYEYLVLVYMLQNKADKLDMLIQKRMEVTNKSREAAGFLISVWKKIGKENLILIEYEQLFGFWYDGNNSIKTEYISTILDCYQKLMQVENEENLLDLMQAYADAGEYRIARNISESIADRKQNKTYHIEENKWETENISISIETYLKIFCGREDCYAEEIVSGSRVKIEDRDEPLNEEIIEEHLKGRRSIATYPIRNNKTAHFMVFDIDISKKILLQNSDDSPVFQEYMQKAAACAAALIKKLKQMGISAYLEKTGYRGFHVWVFFDEWIAVRYLEGFQDTIAEQIDLPDGIQIEYFPDKTKNRRLPGQCMRLPLGIHGKTGHRSCMMSVESDGRIVPIESLEEWHSQLVYTPLESLRRISKFNTDTSAKTENIMNWNQVPEDIFGPVGDSVMQVLTHCNLMRWIALKAVNTGYLTHAERLSLLYVFGHMGESGKEFVHRVMEHTLNYSYMTTQKFIQRIPDKPVSCTKLREQYKQITAEIGCTCMFQRAKNCYPSPVLHAVCKSNDEVDDITIPECRSLPASTKTATVRELNVHQNVQKIVSRILELKKQQRGTAKAIAAAEGELGTIFDSQKTDSLEIEMGMLVRRKKEGVREYEWIIEV